MKTKNINLNDGRELLVVELPKEAINPIISMGYLLYREPNYKNWATDDILMNPVKCIQWEEGHSPDDDYKDAKPIRVADGNWKLLGKLSELTEEDCDGIMEYKTLEGYRGSDEYFHNPIDALLSVLVSERLNIYSNLYIFKLIE